MTTKEKQKSIQINLPQNTPYYTMATTRIEVIRTVAAALADCARALKDLPPPVQVTIDSCDFDGGPGVRIASRHGL